MHRSLSTVRNWAEVGRSPGPGLRRRGSCRSGVLFGIDEEDMSPRARVAAALAALVPVMLSGVFLLAVAPGLWWILTTYGWVAFPASGLLVRGLAGMSAEPSAKQQSLAAAGAREKELLGALAAGGELSPAQAAIQTSLSVSEAEGMFRELAEDGHLEVRVRDGGIFYALWGTARQAEVDEEKAT